MNNAFLGGLVQLREYLSYLFRSFFVFLALNKRIGFADLCSELRNNAPVPVSSSAVNAYFLNG